MSAARAPCPPGTMRTSRFGAAVSVWVGTMDWTNVGESWEGLVETGETVLLMMERLRGWIRERSFRASSGPKTSRASHPGKIRRPMWRGGTGVKVSGLEDGNVLWNQE